MKEPDPAEMLSKHSAMLAEHFDSVLLLTSRLNPDGTTTMHVDGSGNWYARVGMAREFLIQDKNFTSQPDQLDDSTEDDYPSDDDPD